MNRHAIFVVLAIAIMALIAAILFCPQGDEGSAAEAETALAPPDLLGSKPQVSSDAPPVTPANIHTAPAGNGEPHILDFAKLAEKLHLPDRTVEEDLSVVDSLIGQYLRIYKSVPAGGLNAEIVEHLMGENIQRLAFIDPDHPSISASGDLLDRFGTPYFFHPVSREEIEVRSAGPDQQLWTDDDVTLK